LVPGSSPGGPIPYYIVEPEPHGCARRTCRRAAKAQIERTYGRTSKTPRIRSSRSSRRFPHLIRGRGLNRGRGAQASAYSGDSLTIAQVCRS
jgi:hypothetical protein